MNKELVDALKNKNYLFWDVKNPENLSENSIVERVLIYGQWEDVLTLLDKLGMKRASEAFHETLKKKRVNYHPRTINYFSAFFDKYAK